MIYTTPLTTLLSEVDAEGNPVCDFSQIVEDSAATVRRSLDGTKFIAKFYGDTPTFLDGLDQYTHEEILVIVKGSDWTDDSEI
tara:strand:- start:1420 stop:1668 length:249 start_codon:yes stop_codon:yes gene_type:complete